MHLPIHSDVNDTNCDSINVSDNVNYGIAVGTPKRQTVV